MKSFLIVLALTATLQAEGIENPQIDFRAFAEKTKEAESLRSQRRIDEATFLKMGAEPNTIILDLRSTDKFRAIHVKGAKHLAYTDITETSLTKLIPDKNTRILIYCNNNFTGEERNFAAKTVALNIPSYITLHAHGYKNIYELGPLLNIKTTKIPFEGSEVAK